MATSLPVTDQTGVTGTDWATHRTRAQPRFKGEVQLERGRGFVLVTLLAEVSQYHSQPAGGALSISVSILLRLQLLLLCAVLLGGAHPLKEAQLGREEEAEWRSGWGW